MKNIFSNFGTKKVAGVVLAGATLLVGLGVVSNFSDNGQKAVNEAALARFENSAYNNFMGGGSSRADLERQMSAGQDGYTARFLKGKSDGTDADEAFSSDGAYAEGMRGDGSAYGPGGAYGVKGNGSAADNGIYQSIDSTYEQGGMGGPEFEGDNGKGSGAYGEAKFQAAQDAAAAAAAKGVKGNAAKGGKGGQAAGGRDIRQGTQMNKLAASSGGSSFGKGGGGSGSNSGGFDGGSTSLGSRAGGDNNTRALPQTNIKGGTGDGNAFKFGRAGGMGGFNTDFSGKEVKGGQNRGNGAASDLQIATAYSVKGAGSKQAVDQKSLAEAAFDGSNPEDLATTIPENATIGKVASNLMKGIDIDLPEGSELLPPELEEEIQDTAEKAAELAKLQNKLTLLRIGTIVGALIFSIGIFFLRKIPGPWGLAAAIIATVAAAAFLVGMGLWMKSVIDEMADPKFKDVNQGIAFDSEYFNVIKTCISSGIIVGLGWTNKWSEIFKKIKDFFSSTPTAPSIPMGEREAIQGVQNQISQDIVTKTGGLH